MVAMEINIEKEKETVNLSNEQRFGFKRTVIQTAYVNRSI